MCRIRLGRLEAGGCRIAGFDDILERLAFVLHVPFHGFDEIRDEVMTASELDVDLSKSILHAITLIDQPVVNTDSPEDNRG